MNDWTRWLAVAGLTVQLGELSYLHRFRELHHGYYGAGMMLAGAHIAPERKVLGRTLEVTGGFLLSDDLYQHGTQAYEKATGQPIQPDFTPVHKLGARVYGIMLRWGL